MNRTDDAHSWDRLARALRYVLQEFDLDLSQVGAQQRLRYEDFEAIFYHLFLVYDPNETKRRFRSVCAARNPEERTKFIELTVRYVNDRQLAGQRVTTSQLRMLGGEPFRRLVGSLIRAACDAKLERQQQAHERSLGPEDLGELTSVDLKPGLAHRLEARLNAVQEDMQRFREAQDKLRRLRVELAESNQEVQDKWRGLAQRNTSNNLSLEDASNSTGGSQSATTRAACDTSSVVRALLARLEVAHAKGKQALERIQSIKLPQELAGSTESAVKKRLSQFIRETARKFDTSQELDSSRGVGSQQAHSGETDPAKLLEFHRQQLIDYDQSVDRLRDLWLADEERLDEALLQEDSMRTRYEELERQFPIMKLAPIIGAPGAEALGAPDGSPEPSLEFIKEVLAMYPDDRYDDRELLEASKGLFK